MEGTQLKSVRSTVRKDRKDDVVKTKHAAQWIQRTQPVKAILFLPGHSKQLVCCTARESWL